MAKSPPTKHSDAQLVSVILCSLPHPDKSGRVLSREGQRSILGLETLHTIKGRGYITETGVIK